MNNKINYSFIIPHYNTPDLLRRCIKSIQNRNDIQIIVVDDASSNFGAFNMEEFPNVTFIVLTNNSGAGHCRNVAIPKIEGLWTIFADADDFFTSDAIDIFDKHLESVSDVVYFDYDVRTNRVDLPIPIGGFRKSILKSNKSDAYLSNYLRYALGCPVAKMVKSTLLKENNILFDECYKHNDTIFSLKVGIFAKNISIDNSVVYVNEYRENSITTAKVEDVKRYIDCKYGVEMRYKELIDDHNINSVKWRLFFVLESSIRFERYTLSEIYRFLKRNNMLAFVAMRFPIYAVHRLFKRKTNSIY